MTAGVELPAARIVIQNAPDEHVGRGVGTQLSLGVARLLLRMAGHHEPTPATLAEPVGAVCGSGVGLHGFARRIDRRRRPAARRWDPSLLAHLDFPPEWKVLVILPGPPGELHGPAEVQAFAQLPPPPRTSPTDLAGSSSWACCRRSSNRTCRPSGPPCPNSKNASAAALRRPKGASTPPRARLDHPRTGSRRPPAAPGRVPGDRRSTRSATSRTAGGRRSLMPSATDSTFPKDRRFGPA